MLWRTPRLLIQIGEILEHQSCYELCFDVEATATTNDPPFFLYRCNESYEIQTYSKWLEGLHRSGADFVCKVLSSTCARLEKSTPSCVFFFEEKSQMMTQRIATKSSINARKSHQRVKSAMKCPLTGVKKGATSCFWGRKTARCVDVVNPIIFTWDLKRCL